MYKDGEEFYRDFWGMDCQKQFFEFLYDNRILLDQYTLYAHNGGTCTALCAREIYPITYERRTCVCFACPEACAYTDKV